MDLTAQQRRAATLAALLGNALEWFDFAVYGYLATPLGHAFFPAEDPGLQAMAAFGVFAVGYLMRPVGSLVLGPIGDLLGRRNMLSLSIVLMGAASLLIAILPTHAQWGAGAGLALLALRMVQGFSVGGEFTGSMTYATEAARPGQQGLLASLATAGGLVGFSLGSLTVALLARSLGNAAMDAWGWRLPFALVTPIALPVVQLAGPSGLAVGQLLGVLPVMMAMGGQGVLAVEWVSVRQRCTVFSIAYSLAMALFAGTAPVVCSWLLEEQGWQWGPALYCCLFALPAWWALKSQDPRPSPRSGALFCHQPPARR